MKKILNENVLVLNKNWIAIEVITVKQAIMLMCKHRAKAICTETYLMYDIDAWLETQPPSVEHFVKTPSIDFPAPTVILLNSYGDLYQAKVKFSSMSIYRRDRFTCQYCGKRKKKDDLSIDHILPKSRNGKNTWENCVTACFKCNNTKSNRTPKEAGLELKNPPQKPHWSPVDSVPAHRIPKSWQSLLS